MSNDIQRLLQQTVTKQIRNYLVARVIRLCVNEHRAANPDGVTRALTQTVDAADLFVYGFEQAYEERKKLRTGKIEKLGRLVQRDTDNFEELAILVEHYKRVRSGLD